jgi:glycosyltransferase involved in cell wall biosynthesis
VIPAVSIITIFLDAAAFLQEAIVSVFEQRFHDWELILVDDGSSDGSSDIARRHAREHPERVRYVAHDGHANLGMSASRDLGVRHATGRYVAFIDADDVWMPNKLEEQVAILDAQPEAAMVYGLAEYWSSWSAPRDGDSLPPAGGTDYVHELGVPSRALIRPPALITRFFIAQDAAIPGPTSVLVRRDAIHQVGGFETSFRAAYEDQAFYAKICLRFPVIGVDTSWDRYRLRPRSATGGDEDSPGAYADRARFLDWLSHYLTEQGVRDPAMLRALRIERWRSHHPRLARAAGRARRLAGVVARRILPARVRRRAGGRGAARAPTVGKVRFGDLRRRDPISRAFGFDRGQPIDRYYIEGFLSANAADIRGRVMEIGDPSYTQRFGGGRVTAIDVLDTSADNPRATIVGDLTDHRGLPTDAFDCIVLTQTLQFVYDIHAAVRTLLRLLRPGGIVLATVPGISPISRYEADRWGHHWNLTVQSAARLFGTVFGPENISVAGHGNVLAAVAFLEGLAAGELEASELDNVDPDYPVIVSIRAVRPADHSGHSS